MGVAAAGTACACAAPARAIPCRGTYLGRYRYAGTGCLSSPTLGPTTLALRSCHHTRASSTDATLYPRAPPARRPLTGTPANGAIGSTGVRLQVVTHMRMLAAGTEPGVEKNGQPRHVCRTHTHTWCPKPTIPADGLPQAPLPRQ